MSEHSTDVVVIGAGPVGENVAARAARGGLEAVLVEAELVGGECSYWACMPSKTLLRPGRVLAEARRVPGAAQAVSGSLDVAEVLAWRDRVTTGWTDDGQVEWARGAGLGVVRGRGRLTGEREVTVDGPDGEQVWTARVAVVVCTGSVPVTPPLEGLADAGPWGSREATSAQSVPERLGVLGGGVVGCEMAQAFSRMGSHVTLLVRDRLLPRMEPEAGQLVADGLRADGIDVRLDTDISSVERDGTGGAVTLDLGGERLEVDELLVATGRRTATEGIGLEVVGLDPAAPLRVDARGRVIGVGGSWLWAAGDVTGEAPMTHMGKYAARAVGDAVAASAAQGAHGPGGPADDPDDYGPLARTSMRRAVTQVVFTDPEVASVGPTLAEAREQVASNGGGSVSSIDLDISVAGSTVHSPDYTGWARLVVDDARQVLLGATFVGPDVSEMLHSATVAVVGEVTLDRLWHAVPAYPTVSEVWLKLLEASGR